MMTTRHAEDILQTSLSQRFFVKTTTFEWSLFNRNVECVTIISASSTLTFPVLRREALFSVEMTQLFINSTSSLVNVAMESREICARNQSGHLQANFRVVARRNIHHGENKPSRGSRRNNEGKAH